jgi:AcrR family transcriptional regulator
MPSSPGSRTSISTMSGALAATAASAASPSAASPATSKPVASTTRRTAARTPAWSSTIKTLRGAVPIVKRQRPPVRDTSRARTRPCAARTEDTIRLVSVRRHGRAYVVCVPTWRMVGDVSATPQGRDARGPAPGGRARDPELDDAIVAAARTLLGERGVAGLTIEAIARRAGVARATVYRRWANRDALLLHFLRGLVREIPIPDRGHVRDDLVELLLDQLSFLESEAGTLYPSLSVQAGVSIRPPARLCGTSYGIAVRRWTPSSGAESSATRSAATSTSSSGCS